MKLLLEEQLKAHDIKHPPIAWRIKKLASALESISRMRKDPGGGPKLGSVEDIFKALDDIGGMRVSLYFPRDVRTVTRIIRGHTKKSYKKKKYEKIFFVVEGNIKGLRIKGDLARTKLESRQQEHRQQQPKEQETGNPPARSSGEANRMPGDIEAQEKGKPSARGNGDANRKPKDIDTLDTEEADSDSDKEHTDDFNGYINTHFIAATDEQAARLGVVVEIQVTTLIMNVWSQVGHDIIYKPAQGAPPTRAEQRIMDTLNGICMAGESALKQLQILQDARQREARTFFDIGTWIQEYAQPYGYEYNPRRAAHGEASDMNRDLKILFDVLTALSQHQSGTVKELVDAYYKGVSDLTQPSFRHPSGLRKHGRLRQKMPLALVGLMHQKWKRQGLDTLSSINDGGIGSERRLAWLQAWKIVRALMFASYFEMLDHFIHAVPWDPYRSLTVVDFLNLLRHQGSKVIKIGEINELYESIWRLSPAYGGKLAKTRNGLDLDLPILLVDLGLEAAPPLDVERDFIPGALCRLLADREAAQQLPEMLFVSRRGSSKFLWAVGDKRWKLTVRRGWEFRETRKRKLSPDDPREKAPEPASAAYYYLSTESGWEHSRFNKGGHISSDISESLELRKAADPPKYPSEIRWGKKDDSDLVDMAEMLGMPLREVTSDRGVKHYVFYWDGSERRLEVTDEMFIRYLWSDSALGGSSSSSEDDEKDGLLDGEIETSTDGEVEGFVVSDGVESEGEDRGQPGSGNSQKLVIHQPSSPRKRVKEGLLRRMRRLHELTTTAPALGDDNAERDLGGENALSAEDQTAGSIAKEAEETRPEEDVVSAEDGGADRGA